MKEAIATYCALDGFLLSHVILSFHLFPLLLCIFFQIPSTGSVLSNSVILVCSHLPSHVLTHTHPNRHTHTSTHTHTHTHTNKHTHKHTHTHTQAHTHTHTHTHTRTHTHTHPAQQAIVPQPFKRSILNILSTCCAPSQLCNCRFLPITLILTCSLLTR